MINVSIVVPVYNVEKYLEKCLQSLMDQTLDNIEVIVVIDGSPDNSKIIADKFALRYPSKLSVYEKPNGGLSDARNYGLQFCKGEYIGFVDSDDYVEHDMYEKMYSEAKHGDCDIVSCDYYVEYSKSDKRIVSGKIAEERKKRYIDMKAAAWNKLYRSTLLKKNKVLFPVNLVYEDTNFFLKLLIYADKCGYVGVPMVHYVQRNDSIAHTQGKKVAQIFDIFNDVIKYYREQNQFDRYKNELEYAVTRVLLGSSLLRVSKIENADFRKELAKNTVEYLNVNFPRWKSNQYLKECKGINGWIMRTTSKQTIGIIVWLLHYSKKKI